MSALDEIMKVLEEKKGNEVKVTVIKVGDSKDDSEEKEEKEEVKLSIKDSTMAAKIAKMKSMISIFEQVKDLSGDEANDVLGSVGHLAEFSRKPFDLDNDLGMLLLKKSEENTRRLLAELESDESKGD